jgi:hypothetical protein
VSEALQLRPDEATEAGKVTRHKRTGIVRVPKLNVWSLSSEGKVSSKDLRDHLDWLLNFLEDRQEGLALLQARQDVRMNVLCVWWASEGGGGPVLWPEQMQKLAALNLECAFDFQYYGDKELERRHSTAALKLVHTEPE